MSVRDPNVDAAIAEARLGLAEGGIPIGPTLRWIDLPLAAAVALLSVPVFRTRRVVSRWEGGMLVMGYLAFMVSLLVWRT